MPRPWSLCHPGERPPTRSIGGWVGPTDSLDGCGKSRSPPGFDPRTVQLVAMSLYRLSYPAVYSKMLKFRKLQILYLRNVR
jgi:hypothetical protein